MSTETMMTFLQTCGPRQRLDFRIVTQCAPVLKGIKASNLIVGKPGIWENVRKRLKGSRVICVILYADAKREVLFLYRYQMLESLLKNDEIRQFLSGYGYRSFEVSEVLCRLRLRYQRHLGIGAEFPHELGVLLEYPVEDVEGFIQNKGKNSLANRYWKVYHDRERATAVFQMYDEARDEAMEEIVRGYSLEQIAI